MGSGLTPDHNHSRPADVLVEGWERGKPATFDITVTSPLCPAFLGEASQVAGAAALAAETRKHIANDKGAKSWAGPHVFPLLWRHTAFGVKRQSRHFHNWHLVWLLTPHNQSLKFADLYGRLNLTLMRAIGRAILVRAFRPIGLFT